MEISYHDKALIVCEAERKGREEGVNKSEHDVKILNSSLISFPTEVCYTGANCPKGSGFLRLTLKKKVGSPARFRHDCLVSVGSIGGAAAVCALLQTISETDFHVPLIFVLAVFLTSCYTEGYLFGLVTAVLAVLGVNYVFTYPYFALNFSMTGYPLTFLCFLIVSIITSTLASQIRESERARIEVEREKIRSNLLRAISHDLRTPLTSIVGSLNTILENDDHLTTQERCSLAGDAKTEAEWLINMVENLLSITRIGGDGSPNIQKEPQAAEEVISEAVSRFRKMYSGLSVEVRVPDQLLIVPMDAMLIEQVIINLLVNTALHGDGATKAVLSLTRGNGFSYFCIVDDGKGFHPEVLRRLSLGQSPNRQEVRSEDVRRSIGIGLSVCRTIVDVHGGSMSFGNRPGGGASVIFTLPLGEEDYNGTEAEDSDR